MDAVNDASGGLEDFGMGTASGALVESVGVSGQENFHTIVSKR